MRIEELDYDLPEEAIAQTPLADRAASRLLWLHRASGVVEDRSFRDAVDILQPGDLLVLNDTRVTAIRLIGEKPTGGKVELLLLKETAPGEYEALAKPGKRLQPGTEVSFEGPDSFAGQTLPLRARILANLAEGRKLVRFHPDPNLQKRLRQIGRVPLPPYITHEIEDPERYQTVYSQTAGSAAAPTAGLHFTREILDRLRAKGVETATVSLDVGLDTFRPITSEEPTLHSIHGETCHLPEDTKRAVEAAMGRIVAVGTTAVRTLESFAAGPRRLRTGSMQTRLFITPGYEFQIVDGMFTNFHLPRTTMLLMIFALAGQDAVRAAYRHAVDSGYRFLSFGDSMLIL
ncbi:MAG TPA: tRNA preQ1(34) S-adenosylmethionine ribosyltransferase-isomerase QueA [Fimbriimonadaceae bacterium]|nr:tRNA preQ1(34) S-adenosylmethionine ribosyltransferase-isomerase QueA [Fimbriimonadaceae bacterium]